MEILILSVLGLSVMLIGYAFGLGGTVGAIVFLAFVFVGVLMRYSQSLLGRPRP